MKISTIKKPQDWPQNNREAHLTNILNVIFLSRIKNGNTKKKDDTNYFILIIKIKGIYAYRMAS